MLKVNSRGKGVPSVSTYDMWYSVRNIFAIGFSANQLELGTVTIAIMMNNQVMRCVGTTELALFGVIASAESLFQALFGGAGQAIQPAGLRKSRCGKYGAHKKFWKMIFSRCWPWAHCLPISENFSRCSLCGYLQTRCRKWLRQLSDHRPSFLPQLFVPWHYGAFDLLSLPL